MGITEIKIFIETFGLGIVVFFILFLTVCAILVPIFAKSDKKILVSPVEVLVLFVPPLSYPCEAYS